MSPWLLFSIQVSSAGVLTLQLTSVGSRCCGNSGNQENTGLLALLAQGSPAACWLVFPDSLLTSPQGLGTAQVWAVTGLGVTTDARFTHQRLSGTDSHLSDSKELLSSSVWFCCPLKDLQ